jgi:hypothetical protein
LFVCRASGDLNKLFLAVRLFFNNEAFVPSNVAEGKLEPQVITPTEQAGNWFKVQINETAKWIYAPSATFFKCNAINIVCL